MTRKPKSHITYDVKEVSASRAIFQEGRGQLPKIQLTFSTYDQEVVQFELDIEQAGKLIEQTSNAYDAAIPRIRGR